MIDIRDSFFDDGLKQTNKILRIQRGNQHSDQTTIRVTYRLTKRNMLMGCTSGKRISGETPGNRRINLD